MKNKLSGTVSLLTATVIWGFAFIAQSVGMEHIGPFTFQAIRCGLAVIFLFSISFLPSLKKGSLRSFRKQWHNPELWKAGFLCGCALFAAASLQQIGLVSTDAGKAGFITAMYIVLVPILGLFFGQKPGRTAVFSVILAVIGLYLLSCTGASGKLQAGFGRASIMPKASVPLAGGDWTKRYSTGQMDELSITCVALRQL